MTENPKEKLKDPSKEYLERRDLIRQDINATKIKHRLKMDQLAYERENNRLFHENELEKIRIKGAEIRRAKNWE